MIDEFLKTASEGGKLAIEGRGKIGVCDDALHSSANLIPVDLMCGTTITLGMHRPNDPATRYCEINLVSRPRESKNWSDALHCPNTSAN